MTKAIITKKSSGSRSSGNISLYQRCWLLFLLLVASTIIGVMANSDCEVFCSYCVNYNGTKEQSCKNGECYCLCETGYQFAGNSCACFSSHNTVNVLKKDREVVKATSVPMNEVKVGDQVLVHNGNYETVYSISHRHPTKTVEFLQIHYDHYSTTASIIDNNSTKAFHQQMPSKPIELTSKHMLFLHDKINPVPASSIQVGDRLQSLKNEETTTNNTNAIPVVTKISTVIRKGLYNPLTASGTIVINDGIVASTYSARLLHNGNNGKNKSSEWVEILKGYPILKTSHQALAHKVFKPYRYICLGISTQLCKTNDEMIFMGKLGNYLFQQIQQGEQNNDDDNNTMTIILLSFLIMMVYLFDFIFSPHGILLLSLATVFFFFFSLGHDNDNRWQQTMMISKKKQSN